MKSRSRTASLRDLTPATFLKYERLNCLIENHAHMHANLLVNILFENNIFSLTSSVDDPILVRPSYDKKGERNKDEVFFRGYALFCCGEYLAVFKKQMDVPYNSFKGFNYLQIIEALESRRKYSFDQFNHRIEPFTEGLLDYRSRIAKHVLNCPHCYAKLSESVDFLSFKKIAKSINLFGSNNSCDKGFTQSDFNKAISDLESQIAELKAKYPEFVAKANSSSSGFRGVYRTLSGRYSSRYGAAKNRTYIGVHSTPESAARAYDLKAIELRGEGCTTNFAVEGVKTKVLFPDYPATKRHEVNKSLELVREPIQLTMATDEDEVSANPNETIYDRMKAFASENGIEIKTMQTA